MPHSAPASPTLTADHWASPTARRNRLERVCGSSTIAADVATGTAARKSSRLTLARAGFPARTFSGLERLDSVARAVTHRTRADQPLRIAVSKEET